jgi:RNA polymerase sigma-70 factor, ECF subfamily
VDALELHFAVLRSQAGDERAFAELYRWFGRRTLRYLENIVGEPAEDVQQDVWLAVYRSLRSLADPRAFETWLFRITRHRCIDHLRRRKREHDLMIDSSDPGFDAVVDCPEDSAFDAQQIGDSLGGLRPLHREVLILRHWEDLSYAEIARVLGCSVGTVRSRLHYATQRMREMMSIEHAQPKRGLYDSDSRRI